MAISSKIAKSITSGTGAAATHWIVRRITIEPINKTVTVIVAGYFSQAAAGAGASVMEERSFDLKPSDLTSVFGSGKDFISGIYDWLIANTPDFSGGVVS